MQAALLKRKGSVKGSLNPPTTVDDIILNYLKDPKLWEFWYIPYYG